jgi:hypothetical protein
LEEFVAIVFESAVEMFKLKRVCDNQNTKEGKICSDTQKVRK